jgi:hypothetical protein
LGGFSSTEKDVQWPFASAVEATIVRNSQGTFKFGTQEIDTTNIIQLTFGRHYFLLLKIELDFALKFY